MAEECSDTDTEDEMMSVTLTPDTDMVNRVNSAPQEPYRRQIFAKMIVGDRPVRFQLDTGATCNVIREEEVPRGVQIQATQQVLKMYNRTTVKPLGECSLKLRNPATQKKYRAEFVVVLGPAMSILGARTVQQMVDVHFERIYLMTEIPAQPPRNLVSTFRSRAGWISLADCLGRLLHYFSWVPNWQIALEIR